MRSLYRSIPGSMKSLTRASARLGNALSAGLHCFEEPRKEVLIGNNSGLLFALAAIRQHGIEKHPDLHIIRPNFWLDSVHPDYLPLLNWGQSPEGLPRFVREQFYRLFPNHKPMKLLLWEQYKILREYFIDELRREGVNIYSGMPKIVEKDACYEITVESDLIRLEKDKPFHVYNALRLPHVHHGLGDQFLAKAAFELYYRSRSEMDNRSCILLGNGRSAYWAVKHFPSTRFMVIGLSKRLTLFGGEKLPKNAIVFSVDCFNDHLKLMPGTNGEVVLTSTDYPGKEFRGELYTALGFNSTCDLTRVFEETPGFLTKLIDPKVKKEWIAPECMPVGGLAEAWARIASHTNNLSWAHEHSSFHVEDFKARIKPFMENEGLEAAPLELFIDRLRTAIRYEHHRLSDLEITNLYINCCYELLRKTPDSSKIERFVQMVVPEIGANVFRSHRYG